MADLHAEKIFFLAVFQRPEKLLQVAVPGADRAHAGAGKRSQLDVADHRVAGDAAHILLLLRTPSYADPLPAQDTFHPLPLLSEHLLRGSTVVHSF